MPTASQKVGHYRILKELGRGAQGQVFLAEDERLSRRVALKVLSSTFAPSPATLRRFQREAEAASRLDHPGICSVYEAGEADDTQYIAMRYIEGETLARQIQTVKSPAGSMAASETVIVEESTPDPARPQAADTTATKPRSGGDTASSRVSREEIIRIVHLIERAARAVHAAHEVGLIHRDIKPGNIMVTKEGEPVILDFGLARDEESEVQTLTHSGDLLGTPAYMSPEQLLAQRIQLDRRTDVYSLGVTLFECLTLERPFDSPTREGLYQKILTAPVPDPTRLNRQVPRDLKVVLETAMEKDRERRYKTALDLAEDLRRVRSYEPIHARPAGAALRFRRWTQRNPVLATSTLGLFLLLTTGLAISLVLLQRLEGERRQTAAEATQKDVALREKADALKAVQLESDAKAKALLARQEALERAEGLRLTAQASNAVDQNPGLALLLALEAAKRGAGPVLNATIVEALRDHREERVFQAPNGAGGFCFFSPDGRRVLTTAWGGSGTARVWETGSGELISTLRGSSEGISVAEFSPDGALIITAGDFGPEARVWATASGELLRTLVSHRYPINAISFRADGERVVTASHDGSARIWDVATGKTLAVLRGNECGLGSVEYSADGTRILTASSGRTYNIVYDSTGATRQRITSTFSGGTTARLWDAESGDPIFVLRGHSGAVNASLSPDGKLIVTSSMFDSRAGVRIWEASTGQRILALPALANGCSLVLFSPDSKRILTVHNSREFSADAGISQRSMRTRRYSARVWDAATGKLISVLEGHSNSILAASFSADGERVVTGSSDSTARIWSSSNGRLLATLKGHEAGLSSARFTPDGRHVLTSAADHTARVWNAVTAQEPAVLPIPITDDVRLIVLSADGKRVFTALSQGGVVWDAETGSRLATIGGPVGDSGWLGRIGLGGPTSTRFFERAAFSTDGRRLLTQAAESIEVWGENEWKLLASWQRGLTPSPMLACATFSPDGTHVLSSQLVVRANSIVPTLIASAANGKAFTVPNEAVLWDASTGKSVRSFREHSDFITSASFSADGRRAVTQSQDAVVVVWDVASGVQVSRTDRTQAGMASVVISPDGSRLAATTWSLDARILDATTCSQVATLSGHTSNVVAIGFSPDGQRVLTASSDHTARVWDAASGEQLQLLEGHKAPVIGGSFSPDGKQIVTYSEDGTARVWESASGKELIILPHEEGVRWAAFTSDGARVATISLGNVPRVWPLDLVEEARRRKARELTPRERDRYEIGTPDDRRAARRAAEMKDLLLEIDAGTPASAGGGDAGAQSSMLDGTLSRLEQLLAGKVSKDEVAQIENVLLAAISRTRRMNPSLFGGLALVASLDGRPRDAVAALEEAVLLPDATRALASVLEARRTALLPDLVSYASVDAALLGRETLIPAGADWRFFRGRSEPSEGLEWTQRAFDDSAWEKGPSGFGYGDNDDSTVLSDMQQSYTTVYIRHAFQIPPGAAFESLTLSVLVDDGFVAYLNGTEIARSLAGVPGTRVPFDGVADREAVEPLTPIEVTVDPALVGAGANVIAVQGLNRSKRSTDLTLLPTLRAETVSNPGQDAGRFGDFRRAASGSDASNRIAYLDGRTFQRLGRLEEARAAFERLRAADPHHAEPLLRLAECLRDGNDARRAAAQLEEALSGPLRGSRALWDLWFRVKSVDLKVPLAALLARWPGASESSAGADRGAPGDDLRWLLEQLASGAVVRIDCGASSATRVDGALWSRDRFYVGGAAGRTKLPPSGERSFVDPIERTHRAMSTGGGFAGYRIPLPPGLYAVSVRFAGTSARSSRVRISGDVAQEKSSPDERAAGPGFGGSTRRRFDVRVDDGLLEIEPGRGSTSAEISAIEIERK